MKKRTSPSNRQLKAVATKHRLMHAAISLFAEYGFEQVTIDDITSRAGTSRGSFYTHFKSKHDVVVKRLMALDKINYDFYKTAMLKDNPYEQILTYMQMLADYTADELGLDFIKIVYINELQSSPDNKIFADLRRPIYPLLANIVKRGQLSGHLRTDKSSDYIALYFIRLLRIITYEWCCQEGGFDLSRYARELFQEGCEFMMSKTRA